MDKTGSGSTASESAIAERWQRITDRIRSRDERLVADLSACWQDLKSLLEELSRPPIEFDADDTPWSLSRFRDRRAELAATLLRKPAGLWERRRPYRRALETAGDYGRDLQDLVRGLPETVPARGRDVAAAVTDLIPTGWARRVARWRRKQRNLPLRALLLAENPRLQDQRFALEAPCFVTLAESIRHLRQPWETARAALDSVAMGKPQSAEFRNSQREAVVLRTGRLLEQGNTAFERWNSWPGSVERLWARALLGHAAWRTGPEAEVDDGTTAARERHWVEQSRAVATELRLEVSLLSVEDSVLALLQDAVALLQRELDGLAEELDQVAGWLRKQCEAREADAEYPPPEVDVVPSSSRLLEIESKLVETLERLPPACELVPRLAPRPRGARELKKLYPRAVLQQAYGRVGKSAVSDVLAEVELAHRRIVQEIERAREVVAYGLETARQEPEGGDQIIQESLQNALSLMEHQRAKLPSWGAGAEERLVRAVASVFTDARIMLTRDRLGAWSYLAQQGLRRALVLGSRSVAAGLKSGLGHSYRFVAAAVVNFLVYIGWKAAPTTGKVEVVTRPSLPEEFTVDLESKDLPALYRRLFRFVPVEDPRFLIGREAEMAAVAQARAFWEAGRPASLILVGQRGSGKTSMINCALKRQLEGLEVLAGEFRERLVSEGELRQFLADMLRVDDTDGLEQALTARRRVIILEELERTFLRQVGHYGAIRALMRLVSSTCSKTLWILACNQVAFRFLNAAVQLGANFSHRINAGTVGREDLRQAVLLRHNLSGLRLRFSEPEPDTTLARRALDLVRSRPDAESAFFDALSRESGGVYRAAFEIWLGEIETAQAGVLYMNSLQLPDLSPVIEGLDLPDLFTLVAVLQHGSLTEQEHATIFQQSLGSSTAQLGELLAREILEPDPKRLGLRIRPEAMRLAREALYRRNLL